ncbi:MAG TPA: endonuclease III [Gemmatimonadaceae bacterium]|nr:endonuclease III [Gemmatimonadaceae bacterium]
MPPRAVMVMRRARGETTSRATRKRVAKTTIGSKGPKLPFDIDEVMRRIRAAVSDVPDAAMFALRNLGYGTLFQQLVACIISIRTTDEVSLPTALALLEQAPTPADVAALDIADIDAAIRSATFHGPKAAQIHAIARRVMEEFGGELPADAEVLQSFAGVGPKCANLALGVARNVPRISVDVHVWRVVNRWGYVAGRTPEATLVALERVLPKRYWIEINRRLVPFGKHVCTGIRPKCSTCPVLEYCRQVGVTEHR